MIGKPAMLAAGLLAGAASAAALPPTGFEAGRPFPATALPAADDGRPLSIADFRGEKVILHVFASW